MKIFFQLPPVRGNPVYSLYKNNLSNFDSLWKLFKTFELTEFMQHQEDSQLINLLNNVCIADVNQYDIELLK